VIDLNVRGVFVTTQAALKHMNDGGRNEWDEVSQLAQREEVEELDVLVVGAGFAGLLIAS
jgi:NADPH-dependent 2,4-dienoyl-CoA reductase/sulfur reductase-like enzyme